MKKNFFKIIVIIIIIFLAVFCAYKFINNKNNISNIENNTENKMSSNEFENINLEKQNENSNVDAENKISLIENQTEIINTIIEYDIENTEENAPAVPAITDKKEEAIRLVKQMWGDDDSVDFVFDYVNENGEYVVAVRDKSLAVVKNYFKVNVETGNVELDF